MLLPRNVKVLVGVGVVVLLALVLVLIWFQTARASIGNLQIYQGSAEVIRSGRSQGGTTGEPVRLGDVLKTASGSRVAVVLKDSSVIRLESGTEVEVSELEYQGEKIEKAIFKLKFGRLWSRVAPLEQNGGFEVETPTAVAAVAGTSYNTTYDEQITGVYVYRKRVLAALLKNRSNIKSITSDELLRMDNSQLDQDFERGPQPVPTDYIDDWILFNQAEDDKICRERAQTPGCEDYFEPSTTPTTKTSPTPLPEVSTNQPQLPTPTLEPEKKPTVAGVKQSKPIVETPKESPKPVETQANAQATNNQTQNAIDNNQSVAIPTPVPSTEPNLPSVSQTRPPTVAPVIPTEPTPPPPSNDQPAPNPSPPPITLSSLVLSADKTAINIDERTSLKVTAHYSDQSTNEVTSQAKFTIPQGSGTIFNTVFYSGQAGVVKISATFENLTSNELTIEIKHVRQLIDLRLSYKIVDQNKRTAQFTVMAVYSDKIEKDVTSETTWGIQRKPGEQTTSQIDKNGFYQAGRALSDTITAEYQGIKKEIVISFPFESPIQ